VPGLAGLKTRAYIYCGLDLGARQWCGSTEIGQDPTAGRRSWLSEV